MSLIEDVHRPQTSVASDDLAELDSLERRLLGSVRLSIVMPAHNEERTVARAVAEVLAQELPCDFELIVIDDGSSDRTPAILAECDDPRLRVHRHTVNQGKGAAVRTGIRLASGTHLLVFDADLEYKAGDIAAMVGPVVAGHADVVYGCRTTERRRTHQALLYRVGNRVMTGFANMLFGGHLSDLHTCLKLVPLRMLRAMDLRETGFGLDTEITAGLLRSGADPYEVPVSYRARTRAEGKQINFGDAVRCFAVLAAVRFRREGTQPAEAPVVIDLRDAVIGLREAG